MGSGRKGAGIRNRGSGIGAGSLERLEREIAFLYRKFIENSPILFHEVSKAHWRLCLCLICLADISYL